MSIPEMRDSFDDLNELYSETPCEIIDTQLQQSHDATCFDADGSDSRQNNGKGSDEDSNLVGSLGHGSRMHDDEGWENVEDDADHFHSNEAVSNHQWEDLGYERCQIETTGHCVLSDLDLSKLLRNLISAIAGSESMIPDNHDPDVTTPDMDTSGSPSSTYPEPGSGDCSMESSMHGLPRNESTAAYLAFMGPEPHFSPTPASDFTSAPAWLAPGPSLLPYYALSLDFEDGESSDEDT